MAVAVTVVEVAAALTAAVVEAVAPIMVVEAAAAITAALRLTVEAPATAVGHTAVTAAARIITPARPITIPAPAIAIPVLLLDGPTMRSAGAQATAIAPAIGLLRVLISAHLAQIQRADTPTVPQRLPVIAARLHRRTWVAADQRILGLHPRRVAARIPAPTQIPVAPPLQQTPAARAVPRHSPLRPATAARAARPPFPATAPSPTSNILISAAPQRQVQARLAATLPHLISATLRSAARTSARLAR